MAFRNSLSAAAATVIATVLYGSPSAWCAAENADWGADGSLFSQEWDLNNSGQVVCDQFGNCNPGKAGADIQALEAWKSTRDCSNVLVAVMDTGADVSNPDLTHNIIDGKNFVTTNGNTSDFADDNSHGTHVTGTIAANGALKGICQTAKILEVKVADADGRLADSDILAGYNYALEKGAKVINTSFGGPEISSALGTVIKNSPETLLIASAGNDHGDNDRSPNYPANFGYDNIIAVAATNNLDELAWFSNYGTDTVDLAAPGVGILSTTPMYSTHAMLEDKIAQKHALLDGTSMAAPHVTGAVALYWSNHPDLKASEVKTKLLSSTDSLATLSKKVKTGGRLNLARLLN